MSFWPIFLRHDLAPESSRAAMLSIDNLTIQDFRIKLLQRIGGNVTLIPNTFTRPANVL